MRIRLGGLQDWPFIYALGKRGVLHSISPWRKQSLEETLKYREGILSGFGNWLQQSGSVVLIAEAVGKGYGLLGLGSVKPQAVGYLVLQTSAREELTGVLQGWIMDITVLPEWRGKGVGKALLKAAEEKCRRQGIGYLGLAVSSHNAEALHLYQKMGFVEERKLMVKVLDAD